MNSDCKLDDGRGIDIGIASEINAVDVGLEENKLAQLRPEGKLSSPYVKPKFPSIGLALD